MTSPYLTTTKADRKRARRAVKKLKGHALTLELQRLTAVAAKRRKNQGTDSRSVAPRDMNATKETQ